MPQAYYHNTLITNKMRIIYLAISYQVGNLESE